MPAHGFEHFDKYQYVRPQYPVSVSFRGGDDWESTGLDFSDFVRCSTGRRTLAPSRRLDTPDWALRPEKLRALIARFMELRAGILQPRGGTPSDRLAFAQERIAEKLPAKKAVLTRLCLEFVALKKNPNATREKLDRLSQKIEGADSELCTLQKSDRGAAQIVAMVHFYYLVGMDSVGVATQLGIKPPVVRQTLWKLQRAWLMLEKGVELPPRRKPRIKSKPSLPPRVGFFCQRCGDVLPYHGKKLCAACRPYNANEYQRNYYSASDRREKLAQGICGNRGCTRPRWEGRAQCAECTAYYNALARAAYKKHPERWKRPRLTAA